MCLKDSDKPNRKKNHTVIKWLHLQSTWVQGPFRFLHTCEQETLWFKSVSKGTASLHTQFMYLSAGPSYTVFYCVTARVNGVTFAIYTIFLWPRSNMITGVPVILFTHCVWAEWFIFQDQGCDSMGTYIFQTYMCIILQSIKKNNSEWQMILLHFPRLPHTWNK